MTTRKRSKSLPINVASLAAFMGVEQPDEERFSRALDNAIKTAGNYLNTEISNTAPHYIRHGIMHLASYLLLTDLESSTIPLIVRYYWSNHAGSLTL